MPTAAAILAWESIYPTYLDFKANVPALSDITASMSAGPLAFVTDDPSAEVLVSMVTPNFFETLGVRPAVGKFFSESDGFPTTARTGGPALAVVSYAFWQRELGGAPAVLGQNIRVGKLAYNVVAVAPANFRGIDEVAPDVWVPITVALEAENPMRMLGARDGAFLQLIGRVAKGASRSTVEAQSTTIYRATDALNRLKDDTRPQPDAIAASVVPGRGPDAPREIKITLWLGGVSALVLLIVCANVANLLLSRAFTRRREIAVRLALGAGRGRLARQLLAEALLLSAIGGLFGLYLAAFGGRVMQQWLQVRATDNAWIDVRLVLFTLAVTVGTGVRVSLVPMLQSTSPSLSNGLRASTSNGGRGISARTVLLATQAALCVVMLIGAGLFAQSLRRVQQLDLGVDLDHTLQISMFGAYYMNVPITEAYAMFAEIKRQVDALPGVRRSAYSSSVFGGGRAVAIHTIDKSFDEIFPRGSWNEAMYEASVDSGMFQTLGVTSLRGRDFNSTDRRGEQRVTILNLPLANRLFPNGDALGQCVVMPVWQSAAARTECVRVVGVLTGYYRRSLLDRDGMVAFIPLAQQTAREPAYVLYASTVGNADLMAESVRKIVRGVRPDLRRLDIKSMRAAIEPADASVESRRQYVRVVWCRGPACCEYWLVCGCFIFRRTTYNRNRGASRSRGTHASYRRNSWERKSVRRFQRTRFGCVHRAYPAQFHWRAAFPDVAQRSVHHWRRRTVVVRGRDCRDDRSAGACVACKPQRSDAASVTAGLVRATRLACVALRSSGLRFNEFPGFDRPSVDGALYPDDPLNPFHPF